MNHPERDDEFELFLKRRTVLPPGASIDDGLEPPRALDEVVLKKAREAISAQQRSQRPPRWAVPTAIAATVLLCLSIALNVSLNTNRTAVNQPRVADAGADKLEQPAAGGDSQALNSVMVTAQRREAADEKRADAALSGTVAMAVPPAPEARPAAAADAAQASAAAPPSAPAVAMNAPAPAAEPSDGNLQDVVVTGLKAAKRKSDGYAQSTAPAAASHPGDPKSWLKHIDSLRARGQSSLADAEMQRFRAAFPNYPLNPQSGSGGLPAQPDPR